jgi:hypothetical protein
MGELDLLPLVKADFMGGELKDTFLGAPSLQYFLQTFNARWHITQR